MDKEIKLEKFRLTALQYLEKNLVDDLIAGIDIDWFGKDLVARIRSEVYGEDLNLHHEVKYPDGWWQAFRERWFPRFILNRWPVKYVQYTIEAKALYPKVSLPAHDPKIRLFINQ